MSDGNLVSQRVKDLTRDGGLAILVPTDGPSELSLNAGSSRDPLMQVSTIICYLARAQCVINSALDGLPGGFDLKPSMILAAFKSEVESAGASVQRVDRRLNTDSDGDGGGG